MSPAAVLDSKLGRQMPAATVRLLRPGLTSMIAPLFAILIAQAAGPDTARFEAAQKMQAEGRCAEAIPVLQELAHKHPAAAAVTLLLGRCYFDRADYQRAEAFFRQALDAAPQSADVRFFLGSALGLAGHLPEGIEQLQAATVLDPTFAPAFRVLGMFRLQAGQYVPEARAALETAVRLDPEDGRAEYWLGRYLSHMQEFERARSHFERALSLMPKSNQARLAYAQTLSSLGETELALVEFDAVVAQEPGSSVGLLGRAKCLYAQGKSTAALVAAEAALRNTAETDLHRDTLWLLSRIYRQVGRTADAEAAGRQVARIDLSRDQRQARFRELREQALKYHAEHNTPKLVEALEESLTIDERRDTLVMLGDAYLELGRVAEAEHCFLRALQAGPESAAISRRLQVLRERQKRSR